MNWQAISFDWNQARAFLATAEEGSLSAAARALRQTQPTLGRQVAALEQALGVTLFDRVGRSLVLTPDGIELLDHVRAMAEAANLVSLTASGRSQAIDGHVSITATPMVATYHLPAVLARLRRAAPGVSIEVVAANELQDLTRREADIAIRHVRPEQPDLIAKLVGETSAHLYASKSYLKRRGRPESPQELADADFIGFEHPERLVPMLNSLGIPVTRDNFKVSSASGTVLLELVKHGHGISFLTRDAEFLEPEIERVLPSLEPIPVPIWLVTHRELHTSRRIRLVFDLLAEAIPNDFTAAQAG